MTALHIQYPVLDSEIEIFGVACGNWPKALAQSICQFSIADRMAIYDVLLLSTETKTHLEANHADPFLYSNAFIRCLPQFTSDSLHDLYLLADFLGIRLVVIKDDTDALYCQDLGEKTFKTEDYDCFQSPACCVIAKNLGLFEVDGASARVRVTTDSMAILEILIQEVSHIESMIMQGFKDPQPLSADHPYSALLTTYSPENYPSGEAALKAFGAEAGKLGDIIPEIKEIVGENPLVIICETQNEDNIPQYYACNVRKLAETQRNFREHQVQTLANTIFRNTHTEKLRTLSDFFKRKDVVQNIAARYVQESDEDEKAAIIEDAVNDRFPELDPHKSAEKTNALLDKIAETPKDLESHLYEAWYGRDYPSDAKVSRKVAHKLFSVDCFDDPDLSDMVSGVQAPIKLDKKTDKKRER